MNYIFEKYHVNIVLNAKIDEKGRGNDETTYYRLHKTI